MRPITKSRFSTFLAALVLLGGLAASARQASHTADRSRDRADITAVLSAQQDAWNKGDVDTFLQGYWRSPELTFSGTSGIARGWDGVLARYKEHYPSREAMGQ